jgi:WD40 repeat protein
MITPDGCWSATWNRWIPFLGYLRSLPCKASWHPSSYQVRFVPEERIVAMDFSSDGRYLAVGTEAAVYLWTLPPSGSAPEKRLLERRTDQQQFGFVCFSADGRYLVTAGSSISIWDLQTRCQCRNKTPAILPVLSLGMPPRQSARHTSAAARNGYERGGRLELGDDGQRGG